MEKYTEEYYDDVIGKLANYSRHHYYFTDFDKVYPFTNEYITGYLDYVNFTGKSSALSVLSSGDHTFSLITKGITNIDTFDVNGLTEFYSLGLKRALITIFSYTEFLEFIDAIKYQKEYMYNILKRNLGKANISYIPTDVFNIHKVLGNRRYDFISLSNVLDYATEEFGMLWGYSELEPFISNVETICNDGGIILLHSVLLRRGHDVYEENIPVFRDSAIYKNFLKDLEYHVIPSTRKKEGVVLKKVSRMG